MAVLRARRMRLCHASQADTGWLAAVLDRVSRGRGARVDLAAGGLLTLRPV